jgi:hypothetical protein
VIRGWKKRRKLSRQIKRDDGEVLGAMLEVFGEYRGGCVRLRTNEEVSFDDAELESKLIWIFGSPRTGSTWLLEMLCHPLKVDPNSDVGFKWRALRGRLMTGD